MQMKHKLFTQNLLKYIPSLVIQRILEIGDQPRQLPEVQSLETVAMFADISGFTVISEACSKMGARGAEELVFCINRYMEGLVKCITKYGGDIIKFVGDAMIVIWPRGQDESLAIITRKAIQSGLEIQTELNNKRIMQHVSRLSVKIGIGVGKCGLLYVGGVFKRAEFFAVGDALLQALESEHLCVHGGQVTVSHESWELVKDFFVGSPVGDHGNHEIKELRGTGVRASADALLLRNQFDPARTEKIHSQLQCYIPAAIAPYIELNMESFGAETRRLTIMFASLGLDLSNATTQTGVDKIQTVVTTVQRCVYSMEGSLNKLVMDDKGSTLICIWGLSPFAHDDDAARAVLCAIQLTKQLSSPELDCWCNIGISTGIVFAGVVGTSGSRKEYSVIGDIVNLSARIMGWPKATDKPHGNIYVDQRTRNDASNKIRFIYKTHASFKGKSFKLPIFSPVDPDFELIEEKVNRNRLLLVHPNPFLFDNYSQYQYKAIPMIGCLKLKETAIENFNQFVTSSAKPSVDVISGRPGSGKTLFARSLADEIEKINKDPNLKVPIEIFASQLNPLVERRYLNNWRIVLVAITHALAKSMKMKREEMIEKIITTQNFKLEDSLFLIEALFSIKLPSGYKAETQYQLPSNPNSFIKKEEYPDEMTDKIIGFILYVFKLYVNEAEKKIEGYEPSARKLVIFLDDAWKMDKESWKLLFEIQKNTNNIFIYVILMTNEDSELELLDNDISQYYEWLETNSVIGETYTISRLSDVQIKELIAIYGKERKEQGEAEICLMIQAEEAKAIELARNDLRELFGIKDPIREIFPEALPTIISKTEGNALLVLQFILSLINGKYLENKEGVFYPNDAFQRARGLDDWSFADVPDFALRINARHIERIRKATSVYHRLIFNL